MRPLVEDRRLRPFLLDNPLKRLLFPPKTILEGHVTKGMIVADLGCGPGYLTLPVAEIVGAEGRVYAVDFDEKSIVALTEKAKRKSLSSIIDARVSSAANLPFIPDGTIDLVFAKGLLCCMFDHDGALREIHRMLKSGGFAYLSVTKLVRKKDGRSVGTEEWGKILGGFEIQKNHEGITNRWAWVIAAGAVHAQAAQVGSPK
jgi:ubiquinone/menaquinone biosynthesis C-methylase UbiE